MKTKHPELKDKPLEFFERRKRDYEGEKRSLKTALSTNSDELRASYLVSYRIAKTKKPFTIGVELILPACIDICREVLGESAAKKIAQVPLSARTVARQIEDMEEDIETQLLEQIVKSPWFAIQCDESTDIENKAVLLVFVRYLHEEDIHEDILCALLLPKNTTASELFKSLNEYFSEKLNWSFCIGVCTDGASAMIGHLSGLTVRIKEVAQSAKPLIVSFTGKCWRAENYHLSFTVYLVM